MATQKLRYEIGFAANTQELKRQLQQVKADLNNIANLKFGDGFGSLTNDMSNAALAARQLNNYLEQATNKTTGKLNLNDFRKSIQASGISLQDYANKLSAIGPQGQKAFLQVAGAVLQADTQVKRSNAALDKMWTTLTNTIRWQISTAAINTFTGAISAAYNYSKDLNESLTNIRIVTGKSVEEMKDFAKYANQAAKQLSTTTTEYTDAALIYYQQGLEEEQVKERTNITIDLANVTGQTAQEVSDQMTAIWNNFDNGSESLEYYADVLAALGAATASSTEEISEGLEKFAATAETVGLSYEYATAALATVTATTRQSADVVGTAFKTLFSRLEGLQLGETLDDGTTLNKYSQALATVGVNIKDTNGGLKDMDDILDELGTRWNQLNEDQQVALAQTVGGTRQYTQLIALMDNWSYFQENLQVALGSEGTVSEQADIYASSWEAASDRVTAAAEGVYQTLVNDEFFIDAADFATGFLDVLNNVLKSMGGFNGLLATGGSLLTYMFRDKITAGIANLSLGFKNSAKQAAILNKELHAQALSIAESMKKSRQISGTEYNELTAMVDQARRNEEIFALEGKISNEQFKQLQYRNEHVAALQKEALALDVLLQKSGYLTNTESYERAGAAAAEYGDQGFSSIINGSQFSQKTANLFWNRFNQGALQGRKSVQEIYDAFVKMAGAKNTLNNLSNSFKAMGKSGKLAQDDVEEINATFKNLGMSTRYALDNAFEDFEKDVVEAKTATQELQEILSALFRKRYSGEALDELLNDLQILNNETEDALAKQQALERVIQRIIKANEEANGAALRAAQKSQALAASLQGFMALSQTISSVNAILDTLGDNSIQTSDKIEQLISGLSMLGMTGVMTFNQLKTAADTAIQVAQGSVEAAKAAGDAGRASAIATKLAGASAASVAGVALGIIAALAAAVVIVTRIIENEEKEQQNLIDKAKEMNEALAETKEAVEANQELASSFDDLVEAYDKAREAGEDTESIQEELKTTVQQLSEKYDLQGASLAQLTGDYNDYLDVLKQVKVAQKEELSEAQQNIKKTQEAQREAILAQSKLSQHYVQQGKSGILTLSGWGTFGEKSVLNTFEQYLGDVGIRELSSQFSGDWGATGGLAQLLFRQSAAYKFSADVDTLVKVYEAANETIEALRLQYSDAELQDLGTYQDLVAWVDEMAESISVYQENLVLFHTYDFAQELIDIKKYENYVASVENLTQRLITEGKTEAEALEVVTTAVAMLGDETLEKYSLVYQNVQDTLLAGTTFSEAQLHDIFGNEKLDQSVLLLIDWSTTTVNSFNNAYKAAYKYNQGLNLVAAATSNLEKVSDYDDWSGFFDIENFAELQTAFTWGENGLIDWSEFIAMTAEARKEYLAFIETLSYQQMYTGAQQQLNGLTAELELLTSYNLDDYRKARQSAITTAMYETGLYSEDSKSLFTDFANQNYLSELQQLKENLEGFNLTEILNSWNADEESFELTSVFDEEKENLLNNFTKFYKDLDATAKQEINNLAVKLELLADYEKQLAAIEDDTQLQIELQANIDELKKEIESSEISIKVQAEVTYSQTISEVQEWTDAWGDALDTIASGLSETETGAIRVSSETARAIRENFPDIANEFLKFNQDTGLFTIDAARFDDFKTKVLDGYKEIQKEEIEAEIRKTEEHIAELKRIRDGESAENEAQKTVTDSWNALQESKQGAMDSYLGDLATQEAELESVLQDTHDIIMANYKEEQDAADGILYTRLATAYAGKDEETAHKYEKMRDDIVLKLENKTTSEKANEEKGFIYYKNRNYEDNTIKFSSIIHKMHVPDGVETIQDFNALSAEERKKEADDLKYSWWHRDLIKDLEAAGIYFNEINNKFYTEVKSAVEETVEAVDEVIDSAEQETDTSNIDKLIEYWEGYLSELELAFAELNEQSAEFTETVAESLGMTAEELEDLIDKLHEYQRLLQSLENDYNEISAKTERAFGNNRIDLLDKEIELLKERGDILNNLVSAAQVAVSTYGQKLANEFGVTFYSDTGEIKNYAAVQEQISNMLKNDDVATQQQGEYLQELVGKYEEAIDNVADYQMQQQEAVYEAWDKELEKFDYQIEVQVKFRDMEKAIQEFKKKVNEAFGDTSVAATTENIANAFKSAIAVWGGDENTLGIMERYAALQELAKEPGADIAKINEEIEALQGEMISAGEDLLDVLESMESAFTDALSAAKTRFDQFTNQLSHNTTVLSSIKELYALQGISTKTAEGLNKLQTVAKESLTASATQAAIQKRWMDETHTMLLEAEAELAKVSEDDANYGILKAARDALLEEYNSAQEAMLSSAKEAMEMAQEIFTQSLENAKATFESVLTNDVGFDFLQTRYDNYIDSSERYLDNVNALYEVNKLNRAIEQSIDKSNSSYATSQLKALQQEIALREQDGKLSQYEVDLLNAKYDMTLKQIALEEAQNAKTQMRLQRDSQGNWNYVYTADTSAVSKAQQEFEDAQNEVYNLAKDQVTETTSTIISTYQECQEKLEEIWSDTNLSQEEKLERSNEIVDYYLTKIQDLYNDQQEAIADMAEAGNEIIDGFENTYADALDGMTTDAQDFKIALEDYLSQAASASREYNQTINQVAEETGTTLDELAIQVNGVSTATQIMADTTSDVIVSMLNQVPNIETLATTYSNYADEIWRVVNAMRALELEKNSNYNTNTDSSEDIYVGDFSSNAGEEFEEPPTIPPKKVPGIEAIVTPPETSAARAGYNDGYVDGYADGISGGYNLRPKSDNEIYVSNYKNGYNQGQLDSQKGEGLNRPSQVAPPGSLTSNRLNYAMFDNGGYTGEFAGGRFAMLHEKELVLKQDDTRNVLAAVNTMRSLDPGILSQLIAALDGNAAASSSLMAARLGGTGISSGSPHEVIQHVDINANFPGVQSAAEIEQALHNIVNEAAQYASINKD